MDYEQFRVIVREQMDQQVNDQIIEENLYRSVRDLWASVKGGFYGGKKGLGYGTIGGAITAGALLLGFGIASPEILLGTLAVGSMSGLMYGFYAGSRIALDAARQTGTTESEDIIEDVIKVTKKRDKLFEDTPELIEGGDPDYDDPRIERYQSKSERLTQKQERLGEKLQKALRKDVDSQAISRLEYNHMEKIANQAAHGKLTYIEQNGQGFSVSA